MRAAFVSGVSAVFSPRCEPAVAARSAAAEDFPAEEGRGAAQSGYGGILLHDRGEHATHVGDDGRGVPFPQIGQVRGSPAYYNPKVDAQPLRVAPGF